MRSMVLLSLGLLVGCPADDADPPSPEPPADLPCEVEGEGFTAPPCSHQISSWEQWEQLARPSAAHDQIAFTKYLSPARDDARLPALFMNVGLFTLHYELLSNVFDERFPLLSPGEYNQLVLTPDREFTAGSLVQLHVDQEPRFAFTVLDDPADEAATVSYAQVLRTYHELSAGLKIGELAFLPKTSNQAAATASWDGAVPVVGADDSIQYEVYTQGVGYGTVRLFDLKDLAKASAAVDFGYEDILILDEAPADIEQVISGAVTGTRQGELSHLNVRSAARGTPNCFVRQPHQQLAQWEGRLVRLECGLEDLSVEEASPEEAQEFWQQLRPDPLDIPPAQLQWTELEGLLEVPTGTTEERAAAMTRYGSKGSNLASLYQRIDAQLQLQGFLVPMHYYATFMENNSWQVDLGSGLSDYSFADTVSAWLSEPDFINDGALRRQRLADLRAAIRAASVSSPLIDALDARIRDIFGTDSQMLRFRSSSNAEDALAFSGAGIYDSTSACLADERDDNEVGPSHCDSDQPEERSLQRALLKVWASLWNIEAFEERSWYGIDHSLAAMGVLINTRSKNERANFVAFTGNPTQASDERMLVNAQAGELDVVAAEPGLVPEKVLLRVTDGAVVEIDRVSPSSVVLPGVEVLNDAQLRELGAQLWTLQQDFPLDEAAPPDTTLLLDSEWKILEDGRMVVKQVRPFLATP